MKNKITDSLFYIFSILLILSAAFYISEWKFIPYLYAISGTVVGIGLLTHLYKGDNTRLKRLNFQQIISAILIPGSSYFMFRRTNEWVALLLIASLLFSYVIYIQDKELKKKDGKNGNKTI